MSDPDSPPADAYRPVDLRLDRRQGLFITWADGRKSHYPLAFLRKNCPCATCRTEREKRSAAAQATPGGIPLNILPANVERATQFVDASLVGQYALQIIWGNGHRTGIYDFRYLRTLNAE